MLLSEWFRNLDANQHIKAWITLNYLSQDPQHLLATLTEALAERLPSQITQTLRQALRQPEPGLHSVLVALTNALVARPAVIVFDDIDTIAASPEAMEILNNLLAFLPDPCVTALASRQRLPLPFVARCRTRGAVLEIATGALRFTPAEIQTLFNNVFASPISEAEVLDLSTRTEGWAAALSLTFQAGQASPVRTLADFEGSLPDLYTYLAGAVLDRYPLEIQRFLTATSLLEILEPETCNALLDIENAAALLATIERQGLFSQPIDASHTTYRYHGLFRDFLNYRLRQTDSTATVQSLHRRAAAHLLRQGDDEQAIEHLLKARDFPVAAELIESLQSRLFPTSRYHLLARWLSCFPDDFCQKHPWILISQAKLLALQGRQLQAIPVYRKAEQLIRKSGSTTGLYDVYHGLASIAEDQGRFWDAETLFRHAEQYADNDVQRAVVIGQIARCGYMQGKPVAEVLPLVENALILVEMTGDAMGRAGLFTLRGKLRFGIGDFKGALEDWTTAQSLLTTCGNLHQQTRLCSNTAYLHCLLGQIDEAEVGARRALQLAETYDRRGDYAYALNIVGDIRRRQKRLEEARAAHTEALEIQRHNGEQYEIAATANWLGTALRQEGQLNQALYWGEKGLALRESLSTDYETGLSLIDVGATQWALHHVDQAANLWKRALEIFEEAHAQYEQSQLHCYLALVAEKRGDHTHMLDHLERAFTLALGFEHGRPKRCLHFFIEDAAWIAPLLAHAVRLGIASACPECLLPRLGEPALEALVPLLDVPEAPVRLRAATLLGELGDTNALQQLAKRQHDPDPAARNAIRSAIDKLLARPAPPLFIDCLGRLRVWQDAPQTPAGRREITTWERSAARAVFVYLLIHRPNPVPMEQLTGTFWPDSSPNAGRKNLHQAVAALRRALEPELGRGMPSRYLVVNEGAYALQLPAASQVDFEEFERRITPLLSANTHAEISQLEEVLELYQGPFLIEWLYEDWTIVRRECLQVKYLAGLHKLAQGHLTARSLEAAIEAANKALSIDPWNEEATLLIMKAYSLGSNVAAACRAYEQLRATLARDLDLPPAEELTAFYETLHRRR